MTPLGTWLNKRNLKGQCRVPNRANRNASRVWNRWIASFVDRPGFFETHTAPVRYAPGEELGGVERGGVGGVAVRGRPRAVELDQGL